VNEHSSNDPTDPRYYGKYRGTVLDNADPEQRGRIVAAVPDIQGALPLTWALPCLPMAGMLQGVHVVPPIGAQVWIEFEQGDVDYPVWVGGFWGSASDLPAAAGSQPPLPPSQNIVVQTAGLHLLAISDATPMLMTSPKPAPGSPGTGGIVLRSPCGAMVVVNDAGIFINNGRGASIEMIDNTVTINKSALVVT